MLAWNSYSAGFYPFGEAFIFTDSGLAFSEVLPLLEVFKVLPLLGVFKVLPLLDILKVPLLEVLAVLEVFTVFPLLDAFKVLPLLDVFMVLDSWMFSRFYHCWRFSWFYYCWRFSRFLPLLDVFKDSHEPLSFVHTPVIVM